MAARAKCPEALEFIYQTMKDEAEARDTRLRAAGMLLERGYGKAKEMVDVNMVHSFAEVPQTMEIGQWLERRGQPAGEAGDAWLARQRGYWSSGHPAKTHQRRPLSAGRAFQRATDDRRRGGRDAAGP
jgi:hypothetical protein